MASKIRMWSHKSPPFKPTRWARRHRSLRRLAKYKNRVDKLRNRKVQIQIRLGKLPKINQQLKTMGRFIAKNRISPYQSTIQRQATYTRCKHSQIVAPIQLMPSSSNWWEILKPEKHRWPPQHQRVKISPEAVLRLSIQIVTSPQDPPINNRMWQTAG